MRYTDAFLPTLKEDPQDAECKSHRLMIRAGLIRKLASGTYSYLPFGLKVLQKIEAVIRDEMNRAGALEVLLPALHPAELWEETGRLDILRDVMFRFKDRHGRENVLGPTHEEVITDLARREIRSYKQLPLLLYQIQTKFRDEARPRSGVIRSREFIMKDAYSFHPDDACLDRMYETMKKTYCRIFERCGLKYHIVEADPGAMGGSGSQEFVLFSEAGEDRVVKMAGKVMSVEMAARRWENSASGESAGQFKEVHTPGHSSVEGVASLLKKKPSDLVKTMIFETPGSTLGEARIFAVLVRGDHEVSEFKVRKEIQGKGTALASKETIEGIAKSAFGFSGPVGLPIPLYIDSDVMKMKQFVTGANKRDYHLVDVNAGDILAGRKPDTYRVGDYRQVMEGDSAPDGSKMEFHTAIELGHIFKLNLRYSAPMKAAVLDEAGKERPVIMGCYGIGVNRIMAAAIEQESLDKGIRWPSLEISPFQVLLLPLRMDDAKTKEKAVEIYEGLKKRGVDVAMDDRSVTAGIKFNDADLVGVPLEIVLGPKNLDAGKAEVRLRNESKTELVDVDSAVDATQKLLTNMTKSR